MHTTLRITLTFLMAALITSCTPHEAIWLVFHDHGDHVVEQANRIAHCESRHDPNAVSRTNDHGLFQINAVHRHRFAHIWHLRYDPFWNAVMAEHLWMESGWRPWSCAR